MNIHNEAGSANCKQNAVHHLYDKEDRSKVVLMRKGSEDEAEGERKEITVGIKEDKGAMMSL